MNYLDFELEIGLGAGREYPVAVLHSPAGEARATMRFPFDELALENRLKDLQIALLRSGGKRRNKTLPEEQAVQDFGRALFDALFAGEVRSRYDMSQREATQKDMGLRLKLRIQSPALAALPWEFLYDPRQAEYVCLSRNTPIVRYVEIPQPLQPLTVTPPLRILGMAVSPHDPYLPQLDLQREKQRVQNATQHLRDAGLIELTWLPGQTWRDLQKTMRAGPWHIFHFIGHGGFDKHTDEGLIYLADEAGASERLTATNLGRLLADHRSLRLVLLNACEGGRGSERDLFSSAAAILVRRGIPAVLAMQHEITDRAAIEFSRAFYDALAEGMPIDATVVEARKAVSLAVTNTIEWGTPVLYMRSPDGQIFNLPPIRDKKPPADFEARQRKVLEFDLAPAKETEEPSRTKIAKLLHEAEQAAANENWHVTIEKAQEILTLQPAHEEAKVILSSARAEQELAALYAEGREHFSAKQWTQALDCFRRLQKLSAHYKDVDTLVKSAEREWQREQEARKPKPPPVVDAHKPPVPEKTTTSASQPRAARRLLVPAAAIIGVVLLIYILSNKKDEPQTEIAPEIVLIPGGSFMMGSNDGADDEKPAHQVYVDDFYLDKYEVTVARYARFLQANPSQRQPDNWNEQSQHINHPVVYVSWEDATAFCAWLSKQGVKRVRLPTEAEWEYAARGGLQDKTYPWGDEISHEQANYYGTTGKDRWNWTSPVGSFPANDYGLYDMAGNVWEWCSSLYKPYPYKREDGRENFSASEPRVLRGGSWVNNPQYVRCALRDNDGPANRVNGVGFRCAQDVR